MLVHADSRARATGEPQTITWAKTSAGVDFNLLTLQQIDSLRELNQLGDERPYMTVLTSGSVETHRITVLPPEANAHV